MADHEKEPANDAEKFADAVAKDPAAKRISDFATSPPPKDIASIKAASDLLEAEDELKREEAPEADVEDES